MSSRKEQKERLRQERLERERAAAASAARKRRFQLGGGAILLAAAAVALVVVLIGSGGGSNNPGASSNASNTSDTGAQAGVQTSKAPWKPEYSFLAQRLSALNFPEQSDAGYHVHAELFVYVNGNQITVPANLGIDPQGRFLAPIHTHDSTGIIHLESTEPYPFTLGQTFDIWGVKFSATQLGAYTAGAGNVLQVWINGKQIADPVNYKLKAHDIMIVGYGKPGSFPTKRSFTFTNGL